MFATQHKLPEMRKQLRDIEHRLQRLTAERGATNGDDERRAEAA
jgi:hypothetical protein